MAIQSPKSKRPHAPGESPATDNNPESRSGGTHPERHGTDLARSKEHVPDKSNKGGWSGAGGGVQSGYSSVPTHSPAPSQGGGPGYADKGNLKR